MQALHSTSASTQAVTRSQSLAAVHTLLRAGLSCITFLRNLLPEDNFTEGHLTTADESFQPSASETDATPQGPSKHGRTHGFRIMTLTRGYTDEADRLLNYMENGIFDALEKEYLRSFIFAIYLDSNDPTNIVEAYTFNFKYHTVPGTKTIVPVMTLGDDLQNMALDGRGEKGPLDPVAEAIQKGKAPTVREVKKSVKTMIKTLIQAITHMEDLPRRRYATFKLFYTDKTPTDYEPPNFQTGDEQKDRWYFMTHNLDEIPDRVNVGQVNSGYHSVNLKVTSIATYLPAPSKDDVPFSGTFAPTKRIHRPRATPNEEALLCARQAEELHEDASSRNLVWSTEADTDLVDAEGEGNPDYLQRPDGTYERIVDLKKNNEPYLPVGLRTADGQIEPIQQHQGQVVETQQEAQFAGMSERIPTRLNEINSEEKAAGAVSFEETQALIETQPMSIEPQTHGSFTLNVGGSFAAPPTNLSIGSLPPSNLAMDLQSPMSSAPGSPINTQSHLGDLTDPTSLVEDTEMLGLEAQPAELDFQMMESIQSFTLDIPKAPADTRDKAPGHGSAKDIGLRCDCTITAEDETCFCEGGCGRWYHVWCMGFHSTDDSKLPAKFVCFDCRLKADAVSWMMIKESVYPQIMTKYRDFVTLRRAIKVAERSKTITPPEFAKSFDGDISLARQLLKHLEEEDFIKLVTTAVDEFGMTFETRAKSGKGKDKKSKARKSVQKTRYAFNQQIKSQKKYKDYFTPEQEVESRMLGLDDYRKFRSENDGNAAPESHLDESQTQEETQDEHSVHKRVAGSGDMERPLKKKMKISLATGVDLAE